MQARPSRSIRRAICRSWSWMPSTASRRQHHDLGHLQRLDGGTDRHLLQRLLDPGAAAQAGGIDESRPPGPGRRTGSTAMASRVRPGSGPVIIRSSPSRRFSRVDLPALGRPTMASFSGRSSSVVLGVSGPGRRQPVGDFRHQVGHALAMFGRDADRIAEAQRIGIQDRRRGDAALGLVGDQQHGLALPAQPLGEMLVRRGDAGAGVEHEQHQVGLRHRAGRSGAHPAGEGLRRGFLQPGGVDQLAPCGRAAALRLPCCRGSRRACRRPGRYAGRPGG